MTWIVLYVYIVRVIFRGEGDCPLLDVPNYVFYSINDSGVRVIMLSNRFPGAVGSNRKKI